MEMEGKCFISRHEITLKYFYKAVPVKEKQREVQRKMKWGGVLKDMPLNSEAALIIPLASLYVEVGWF